MENKILLECKEIKKSFGGVHALKGIDFVLNRGEVHALVGENGAGKSTLIKIFSGVVFPDEGSIFLKGKEIKIQNPLDAHRKGIIAVYQEPLVYPKLSVLENIFIGNEIKKSNGEVDWKSEEKRAIELFKSLDIKSEDFIRKPIGKLTTAIQQFTLIAKALNYNAEVIIFDEPTAILSDIDAQNLFKIIKLLRSDGKGIIYISHRLEELQGLADRITVMKDGEIVGTGNNVDMTKKRIIELMAGKNVIEKIQRNNHEEKKDIILKVQGFSKDRVFENISFDLKKGEILGFAGLVGSGRSEVMEAIFGFTKYDKGNIFLEGRNIKIHKTSDAIDLGIMYLPESRKLGLLQNKSILDNVGLPVFNRFLKSLGFINNNNLNSSIKQYVELLSIKAPSLFTNVEALSGGNQQKVLFSKGLIAQPRVLILDEPTHGIDVATKVDIHKLIAKLADDGISVIVVSSELPEIIALSDRVIVMHEGKITGTFEGNQITSLNLISAFVK
ncbi:MAG: sugar ABC transporter ATP-binding protein [Thermotogae bacterium]|jgi:ABC-type sugar transport system ATPase subunit|nr:sugar ABC transporter ATP-binding protein [Thermotogota bacterium]